MGKQDTLTFCKWDIYILLEVIAWFKSFIVFGTGMDYDDTT